MSLRRDNLIFKQLEATAMTASVRPGPAEAASAGNGCVRRLPQLSFLGLALLLFVPASSGSASSAWIPLTPTGGPPAPRRYQSSVYDPGSNRLILFGGCLAGTCQSITNATNEVWVLTNANGVGTPAWIQL